MSSDMDQVILETARRMLEDGVTPQVRDEAAAGTWPAALWRTLDAAGFTRTDPDGLTFGDALGVLEVAGYYAAPIPLAESYLVSHLVEGLGWNLPEGPISLAITAAPLAGDTGFTVQGVPWARAAQALVLVTPHAGGTRLSLLEPPSFRVEPAVNLAGEPLDTVHVDGTATCSEPGPVSLREVRAMAALTRVMLASGTLQRVLDLTVAHVGERRQFGRPLAKFQAVQQMVAEIAAQLAEMRAIANRARADWETGAFMRYAAMAKVLLAQAAQVATARAHQAHGAIGFTEEYQLHHFTRRLWSYRHEYGNEQDWASVVMEELQAEDVWSFLTR
ncbi:MAG: hypothetical protein K6T78_03260 [Alicyclobacillus sp.]|nr:hypothetical protein [Alicyclobacillus sp.]